MPWPSKITRAFDKAVQAQVQPQAHIDDHDNRYYGPYNKLLYTLFPADSDFTVSPNFIPVLLGNNDIANLIVSFEVTLHQHPVLILQVKPPQHLLFNSKRWAADGHIRDRLVDLSEGVPFPALYGISAIGTKLCFYEFERASRHMTPKFIRTDPDLGISFVPEEQWNCDILEAKGEQQLQALVMQIVEACTHLQAS